MLYSSLKKKTVEMPLDSSAYATVLKKLVNDSKVDKKKKQIKTADAANMGDSFKY